MNTLDRTVISDAVRLFEGRAISIVEADKLCAEYDSREDFLGELCFSRGSFARYPDLAAVVERAQSVDLQETAEDRGERAFYEGVFARLNPTDPIALYVPRWRGVAAATRCLYSQSVPLPPTPSQHPDDIDAAKVATYADILLASGGRHFVISGGDNFHLALIQAVLQRDPGIRFDLTWHSNFLQMGEVRDWRLFRRWLHAAEHGLITRFGVTKAGLDEFLRQLKIDSLALPQFLPMQPYRPHRDNVEDVVGIWLSGSSSYRKLPHAMIASVKAMRSFYLKGAGLGAEGMALVSELDVPFLQVFQDPIPYERLLKEMPNTVISLYVTISECSPMLPIESFSVGVPCLIGPSSDLFRDHRLLREMLIVEQPYNPQLIAEKGLAAVERRDDILVAYGRYNREVETRAREALARFLA